MSHAIIVPYLARVSWEELVLHEELAFALLEVQLNLTCKAANYIFFCFSPFYSASILPKLCIA